MDKFGIFNLLNSFFTPTKPADEQNNGNATSTADGANSFLKGLLNNFSATDGSQKQTPTPQKKQTVQPPLQSGMISVMNSHDEFIKRVKARSASPQKTK